jgi:hypothetical protein
VVIVRNPARLMSRSKVQGGRLMGGIEALPGTQSKARWTPNADYSESAKRWNAPSACPLGFPAVR